MITLLTEKYFNVQGDPNIGLVKYSNGNKQAGD